MFKIRVYYHPQTDTLGYLMENSVLGDAFFFADHDDCEVLSERFVEFVDDFFAGPCRFPRRELVLVGDYE